ncbi:MAG: hypothetical protein RIR62_2777 [Pseudomonadota bacterium]
MERVAPTAQGQAATAAASLPQGRGWAVVATEAGFVLRLLASGGALRITDAEVAALKRGELTGEALLERGGMAPPAPHPAPPHAPPPPIYGTGVSISDEGRQKAAGQGGRTTAAPDGEEGAVAGWQVPRAAWIAAGALALLLAILAGMA